MLSRRQHRCAAGNKAATRASASSSTSPTVHTLAQVFKAALRTVKSKSARRFNDSKNAMRESASTRNTRHSNNASTTHYRKPNAMRLQRLCTLRPRHRDFTTNPSTNVHQVAQRASPNSHTIPAAPSVPLNPKHGIGTTPARRLHHRRPMHRLHQMHQACRRRHRRRYKLMHTVIAERNGYPNCACHPARRLHPNAAGRQSRLDANAHSCTSTVPISQ